MKIPSKYELNISCPIIWDNNKWLQHERLGYNYRISDINCALGIAQLERIDEILTKREKVAKLYNEKLKEIICSIRIKSGRKD